MRRWGIPHSLLVLTLVLVGLTLASFVVVRIGTAFNRDWLPYRNALLPILWLCWMSVVATWYFMTRSSTRRRFVLSPIVIATIPFVLAVGLLSTAFGYLESENSAFNWMVFRSTLLSPMWGISLSALATWFYFRKQNTYQLYARYQSNEMVKNRRAVDTWLPGKTMDHLERIYRDAILKSSQGDASVTEDTDRYYETLAYAMFMNQLGAMWETPRLFGLHVTVDNTLFRSLFKPNIARYYLKLATFINHRRQVRSEEDAEVYGGYENLAIRYLTQYARVKHKGANITEDCVRQCVTVRNPEISTELTALSEETGQKMNDLISGFRKTLMGDIEKCRQSHPNCCPRNPLGECPATSLYPTTSANSNGESPDSGNS